MTTRSIILMLLVFAVTGLKAQTADFTYTTSSGSFCHPQSVGFTQTCTGNPVSFIWNFGNGQSGSNATENTIYLFPGAYNVTLTAIYATNAVSVSKTVVISATPALTLTADKNYLCQPGPVVFTVSTTVAVANYEWNFGDGSAIVTTAGGANSITYNYNTYGSFNATVKGITADGCTASSAYSVVVQKFPISGLVSPPSGCIPMNSLLSVSTTLPPGDVPQSFTWNFGDGSPNVTGAAGSINHLYNIVTPITTAGVSVTTAQGCTNQFSFPAFAYGTPPFATLAKTFTARDTFCGSENILFYGKATNANSYSWDFGDGNNGETTDTLIYHRYRSLGNKRVIVTPSFNGCNGVKDTIDIFIEGVIADYTYSNTCGNKSTYSFVNQSLGNVDHFEWTFSDVPAFVDSTNYNIVHSFPTSGSFNSKLYLMDSITGCSDSLITPIFTARPVLSKSTSAVCKDSLIVYRVSNTYPPGNGFTYEFHVGGSSIYNIGDSVLSFFPTVHGNYTEYVIIRDNITGTCSDTLYFTGTTLVRGPVVDFNIPVRVCKDTGVSFINTSYPSVAGDNIIKWHWDFGDLKTDSVRDSQTHFYYWPAYYPISLIATDINGCGGKVIHYVYNDPVPAVTILPAADTICSGDTAILRAYTTDTLLWTPATNINCTSCDTVNVYPTVTTSYIVRAINQFGCKAYDTSIVKVFAPISLQIFPADTSICANGQVPYRSNTTGIFTWTPPDFLTDPKVGNPVAIPDTSITYTIIVTDSAGCYSDTALASVHLLPKPVVDAGPDRLLPYNTAYILTPNYSSDVITYLWTPPGNLNCSNCASPGGIALKKETYQIEVANAFGCRTTDIINILVNCERSNLLMPTAFTPNKDGLNDHFYPITRGYRTVRSFLIFNRYGNKVFERKDFAPNISSLGWDGRVKGYEYGPNEVFTWFLEAECDAGQVVSTKGTVLVLH